MLGNAVMGAAYIKRKNVAVRVNVCHPFFQIKTHFHHLCYFTIFNL